MYRIVIVENELEIRRGLADFIPWAELGFEVVRDFGGGAEALAFLEEETVDVVVTDIRLDDVSGLDIARYLSERRRLESVVLYSAYKDFEYAKRGIAYGVKRYITKDLGFGELVAVFKEMKGELDREIGQARPPSDGEEANPVVSNVVRYLQKSYKTATLESAARVVHLNPYYLSTYIKEKTGDNFRAILARIRMEKARELLGDPCYRTNEIGDLVGYSDARNFVRCFKNYFGMSPSDYKKTHFGCQEIESGRRQG